MNRILHTLFFIAILILTGCDDSSPRSFRPGQDKVKNVKAKVLKSSDVSKNSIGMSLVKVPSGKFFIGGSGANFYSKISPEVTIDKPFRMSIHEVTQGQFQKVMGHNPSSFQGNDRPVENVTWADAMGFCYLLSQSEGKTYRLPTENEWEYACRAGTITEFHTGETLDVKDANVLDGATTVGKTTRVGFYSPNSLGLHDMHGNVSEWCLDYVPNAGDQHVYRGGNGANGHMYATSSSRRSYGKKWQWVGFRVVQTDEATPMASPKARPLYYTPKFTTEEMIAKVDEAFKKPLSETLPAVVILPPINEKGEKTPEGSAICYMANFSLCCWNELRVRNCFANISRVFFRANQFSYDSHPKFDPKKLPVILGATNSQKYVQPVLTKEGDIWKLESTIQNFDAENKSDQKTDEKVFVESGELRHLPGLLAESIFNQLGQKSPAEKRELMFGTKITEDKDLKTFAELLVRTNKEPWYDTYVALLQKNKINEAFWFYYLDTHGNPLTAYNYWRNTAGNIQNDHLHIISNNRYNNKRSNENAIIELLKMTPHWGHDSLYYKALATVSHMMGNDELTNHIIKVWKVNDPTFAGAQYRGSFYGSAAFDSRGTNSASDVSRQGWSGFHKNNALAVKEFEEAIKINPLGFEAHTQIYGMKNLIRSPDEFFQFHFDQANKIVPENYYLYDTAYYVLMKRWSGNEEGALDFIEKCVQVENWKTGIPSIGTKLLHDYCYLPGSGAEDRSFYESERVSEILDLYYENALKNASKDWKQYAINFYARYGSYAGKRKELGPVFEKLEAGEYDDTGVLRFAPTYNFLKDRVFAVSKDGEEKIEASIRYHLSIGEFEEAKKAIQQYTPKITKQKSEKERFEKTLKLVDRLQADQELKLTAKEIFETFDGIDKFWNVKDERLVWSGEPDQLSVITLPFGIQYARINGTIKNGGLLKTIHVMGHTKSIRDIIGIRYRHKPNQNLWEARCTRLSNRHLHRLRTNNFEFKLFFDPVEDRYQPVNGVEWTTPVLQDIPSAFSFYLESGSTKANVAISDLEIRLIE